MKFKRVGSNVVSSITLQATDGSKPLATINCILNKGNAVIFRKSGSYILTGASGGRSLSRRALSGSRPTWSSWCRVLSGKATPIDEGLEQHGQGQDELKQDETTEMDVSRAFSERYLQQPAVEQFRDAGRLLRHSLQVLGIQALSATSQATITGRDTEVPVSASRRFDLVTFAADFSEENVTSSNQIQPFAKGATKRTDGSKAMRSVNSLSSNILGFCWVGLSGTALSGTSRNVTLWSCPFGSLSARGLPDASSRKVKRSAGFLPSPAVAGFAEADFKTLGQMIRLAEIRNPQLIDSHNRYRRGSLALDRRVERPSTRTQDLEGASFFNQKTCVL